MNILLCFLAIVFFPRNNGSELVIETSLNVMTFTPRWSIEPYPGYQAFLANELRLSQVLFRGGNLSLGVEAGVANRFHFTYFDSYATWGVGDTKAWLMLSPFCGAGLLVRLGLPTGQYNTGIGTGAYSFEIYAKKTEILRSGSIYLGYEWVSINPDEIDCGDKIHLGVDLLSWFSIHCHYAFADQGAYFPLYDSPSLAIEISVSKNVGVLKCYNFAVVFNQTVFGKDVPIKSGIMLKISNAS